MSSLESKNKNLEKEIEIFKERKNDQVQNSSNFDKEDELVKYDECDTLKKKMKFLIFKKHLLSSPMEEIT